MSMEKEFSIAALEVLHNDIIDASERRRDKQLNIADKLRLVGRVELADSLAADAIAYHEAVLMDCYQEKLKMLRSL
jgi:hypothetical protein